MIPITRSLVEALAQGVLRIPDDLFSRELETLIHGVLEEEELTEISSHHTVQGPAVFPLYLIAFGVLGAGTLTGKTTGMRGLLAPAIRWDHVELPWMVLLTGVKEMMQLVRQHKPQFFISEWVEKQLLGESGWLRDVSPAAARPSSTLKWFLTTESVLAMLHHGAQELKYQYGLKNERVPFLVGRYAMEADIAQPTLAGRVREITDAGTTSDWFPAGYDALHTRFLKEAGRRLAGWEAPEQ